MESATLGSGGDGGGRTGSDVGRELRWDLVVMGEVELGAIVVDMDEFWDQEETVGEFISCGCS